METFVMDVERLEELFQISPNGAPKKEKDEKKAAIEESVRTLLLNVGEDPDREGCSARRIGWPVCTTSCWPVITLIR